MRKQESQCPNGLGTKLQALLFLVASLFPLTGAAEYTFTKIADNSGSIISFEGAPSISAGGTVAFRADLAALMAPNVMCSGSTTRIAAAHYVGIPTGESGAIATASQDERKCLKEMEAGIGGVVQGSTVNGADGCNRTGVHGFAVSVPQ